MTNLFNLDAEQAVLGSLLLDGKRAFEALPSSLKATSFYDPLHGRLFDFMVGLISAGNLCDGVVVANTTASWKEMQALGGVRYIADLADAATIVEALPEYAAIIIDMAIRRGLDALGRDAGARARLGMLEGKATEIAWRLSEDARALALMVPDDIPTLAESLDEAEAQMDSAIRKDAGFVVTGMAPIDKAMGPMLAGDMIVIGGRPGMGKSTAGQAIARGVVQQGLGCMFFSLEMSTTALAYRLATDIIKGRNVTYGKIRAGDIDPEERELVREAFRTMKEWPLVIDARPALRPADIVKAVTAKRRWFEERGQPLSCVIIDHLTIMRPDRDLKNPYAERTEISGALKIMAKNLGVPIVALSQLNRQNEGRLDPRPRLSDLRETGAIEQDADVVAFVHREAYYHKQKEPRFEAPEWTAWNERSHKIKHDMDWIFAKVRHGDPRDVRMWVDMGRSAIRDPI